MRELFNRLSLTIHQGLVAIRHWPLVEPLLDLFQKERTMVLLLGLVAYALVPAIPNLSSVWAERLGTLIFFGGGIILGGLQLEVLLEARRGLPTTLGEYVKGIATEIVTPTATVKTEALPIPLSEVAKADG